MLILKNEAFDIPFVNQIADNANTFVDVFLSTCQFDSFLYLFEHYFLSKYIVNPLDEISPDEDPESVHEQINSPFYPYFLVLLHHMVEVFKTGIFECLNQGLVLREEFIRLILFRFEHLPQEYLTWYQILENEPFLSFCPYVDHLEMLLCLLEVLVHQCVFRLQEQEVIPELVLRIAR